MEYPFISMLPFCSVISSKMADKSDDFPLPTVPTTIVNFPVILKKGTNSSVRTTGSYI